MCPYRPGSPCGEAQGSHHVWSTAGHQQRLNSPPACPGHRLPRLHPHGVLEAAVCSRPVAEPGAACLALAWVLQTHLHRCLVSHLGKPSSQIACLRRVPHQCGKTVACQAVRTRPADWGFLLGPQTETQQMSETAWDGATPRVSLLASVLGKPDPGVTSVPAGTQFGHALHTSTNLSLLLLRKACVI